LYRINLLGGMKPNAIFCSKLVRMYVCQSIQCLLPNDTFAAVSHVATGLTSYSLPTCLHASWTNIIVLQRPHSLQVK